ncbi:hypothetical protein BST61_g2657 [Cercospora zeina]
MFPMNMYIVDEGVGRHDGISAVRPENPARRDIASLKPNGCLGAQLISDNPGVWGFHCHTAWHVGQGLYINVVQKPDEVMQRDEILVISIALLSTHPDPFTLSRHRANMDGHFELSGTACASADLGGIEDIGKSEDFVASPPGPHIYLNKPFPEAMGFGKMPIERHGSDAHFSREPRMRYGYRPAKYESVEDDDDT